MKFVIFAVAAFAAIQSINCYVAGGDDSEELVYQVNMKMLRDQLRGQAALEQARSKIESVCPGYGSQLENVTIKVQSCLALIDEDQETMCSMVQNHFETCISPLTDMFEECLPAQSKKIPSLLVRMVTAASKHLCKTDGEHIFELGNPCIRNTNLKAKRCARRVVAKLQEYHRGKTFPSAQDVCEFFESFRPCLQSHLNTACGHPITRDSFLQMYDESIVACRSSEMNEIELIQPSLQ